MSLEARIEAALGQPVLRILPVHGGDLSDVRRADLADGRRVIAKSGPRVATEGRMLNALRAAAAPVPELLHAEDGLIVLQYLEETTPTATGWADLGTALRALHDRPGERYGWPEHYAFGEAPIPNDAEDDWPTFWAERRLLAFGDHLPADLRQRIERLAVRLSEHLPNQPPPALLHGDLWAGNVMFTAARPCLIDPACYYGDAEVDLAMLTLFGAPPAEFHAAYGPLAPGHEKRRPLYQLWPALVHLRLFGASYRSMVSRLLDTLGA